MPAKFQNDCKTQNADLLITDLKDFARSQDKTSYAITNQPPDLANFWSHVSLQLSDCSDISKVLQQQCCQSADQITKWYKHFDSQSCSLTHFGLVTPYDIIWNLVDIGSDNGLLTSNQYLNQCWLTISDILQHSLEGNFTRNAQDICPC